MIVAELQYRNNTVALHNLIQSYSHVLCFYNSVDNVTIFSTDKSKNSLKNGFYYFKKQQMKVKIPEEFSSRQVVI